jgi:hypothetical protein
MGGSMNSLNPASTASMIGRSPTHNDLALPTHNGLAFPRAHGMG